MSFSHIIQQHGNRTALILEDQSEHTYAQLSDAVNQLADILPTRQLFFILGGNDYETILIYLAALQVKSVPLLLSSSLHETHLHKLIDTYKPNYVFAPSEKAQLLGHWSSIFKFKNYSLLNNPKTSNQLQLHDDLALLLATSGSTGSPKLVRLSSKNIISNASSIVDYLNITDHDRAITSLPIHYSYGLSVLNSYLYAGASIVVTHRSLLDPLFWQGVKRHQVTSMAGVPYTYEMLLKLRLERLNIESIRTFTQAGGRLEPAKAKKIYEFCAQNNIQFFTMYGQTEATARISYVPPQNGLTKLGSIGIAIPGGKLWLEDTQENEIHASKQIGELLYAGPNVSMGYAETLADLGAGDSLHGILRTGDLARTDEDGYFYIEGRKSRFLKLFGIRISLDAVEQYLLEQEIEAAAHGFDDHLILHAVNSPHWEASQLQQTLARQLGVHGSAISIRAIDEIPRLQTGKVDYACLNQLP